MVDFALRADRGEQNQAHDGTGCCRGRGAHRGGVQPDWAGDDGRGAGSHSTMRRDHEDRFAKNIRESNIF